MLRAGAAAGTAAALAGAGIFAAGTAGAATTAGSVPFLHREHHLPGCRLGVAFSGWAAVNDFFTPYFASLPAAIAYPLRMVGDARRAIEFVDIPAFLGFEIRALYSVAFDGNQKNAGLGSAAPGN